MVNVSVRDKAGVIVPKAAVRIDFDLMGPGRLIGVGNGDPNGHEPDKASFRTTYNGWAQALVQTSKVPGASGWRPARMDYQARSPSSQANARRRHEPEFPHRANSVAI